MPRKRQQLEPQAASSGPPERPQETGSTEPANSTEATTEASQQGTGNVAEVSAGRKALLARTYVRDRLMSTPDWPKVKVVLAEMRADPKLAPLSAEAREQFIWAELDRMYPAKVQTSAHLENAIPKPSPDSDLSKSVDSGRVQGLGDLPPGWPELPANASLVAEIGWVQANRLYVVEELDRGGTRVHLDRAHEPAPSRAAIGWLETSIRSYAKYVEVAAKATGAGQDEQAQERQERMDIEAIRSLLQEMMEA